MPFKDLLFGFRGRVRRRLWWLTTIILSIAYVAAAMLGGMLLFGSDWTADGYFSGAMAAGDWRVTAYDVLVFLPFLWMQSAIAAKRTHDRNKGAAVVVGLTLVNGLLSFAPNLAALAAPGMDADTLGVHTTALNLVIGVAGLYLLIVLGFLDGTRGPNRYGRSPKGIGGEPADKAAEVFS